MLVKSTNNDKEMAKWLKWLKWYFLVKNYSNNLLFFRFTMYSNIVKPARTF